jgi:cytochrome c biogenesis protein CcdA
LYGFGSGLPMVLVGTTAGQLMSKLEKVGYGLWAERVSGTALMTLGLFLLWKA